MGKLTESVENAALVYMSAYPHAIATHWIAKACGYSSDRPKAYRLMKRMEKRGFVQGDSVPGGKVRWWKITEVGRQALQEQSHD